MDLRRLLNTAYVAIVSGMDDDGREQFDESLNGPTMPDVDHRGRRVLKRPARAGSGATASAADLASVIGGP
jgi:hypothetical protein